MARSCDQIRLQGPPLCGERVQRRRKPARSMGGYLHAERKMQVTEKDFKA